MEKKSLRMWPVLLAALVFGGSAWADGFNQSMTTQVGTENIATTMQTGSFNVSGTLQVGDGLSATTTQTGNWKGSGTVQVTAPGARSISRTRTLGNSFTSTTLSFQVN
ncbi:MAG: curlin repeat-containing protein [Pseudorhodobacter sp.]|nr:curlin repeat-containing protein [Pseudorhodobacter sp.]